MPSSIESARDGSLLRFVQHINQVHAAIGRMPGSSQQFDDSARSSTRPSFHAGTVVMQTPVATLAVLTTKFKTDTEWRARLSKHSTARG